MTQVTDDQRDPQQSTTPRPYHAPRLVVYGNLLELTAGGTGSVTETQAMNKSSNFKV
jgi:hypothetical protein